MLVRNISVLADSFLRRSTIYRLCMCDAVGMHFAYDVLLVSRSCAGPIHAGHFTPGTDYSRGIEKTFQWQGDFSHAIAYRRILQRRQSRSASISDVDKEVIQSMLVNAAFHV